MDQINVQNENLSSEIREFIKIDGFAPRRKHIYENHNHS